MGKPTPEQLVELRKQIKSGRVTGEHLGVFLEDPDLVRVIEAERANSRKIFEETLAKLKASPIWSKRDTKELEEIARFTALARSKFPRADPSIQPPPPDGKPENAPLPEEPQGEPPSDEEPSAEEPQGEPPEA